MKPLRAKMSLEELVAEAGRRGFGVDLRAVAANCFVARLTRHDHASYWWTEESAVAAVRSALDNVELSSMEET